MVELAYTSASSTDALCVRVRVSLPAPLALPTAKPPYEHRWHNNRSLVGAPTRGRDSDLIKLSFQ